LNYIPERVLALRKHNKDEESGILRRGRPFDSEAPRARHESISRNALDDSASL